MSQMPRYRNECWRKAGKEQRGAWTVARLIVVSISRPQLDLKECIGTYEFGITLSICVRWISLVGFDKAKIVHHLELLVSNEQLIMHTPAKEPSTGIASNNENGQEREASEVTHGTDLTRGTPHQCTK